MAPLDFNLLSSRREKKEESQKMPKIRYLSNPVQEMSEERLHRFVLYESIDSRTRAINNSN